MSFELKGKIKVIEEIQKFASGFEKQEFVVTTEEQYPQDIKFEAIKDKIESLKGIKEGDAVSVSFNIRGNEYNGKYYVNLSAWRILKESGTTANSGDALKNAQDAPWPSDAPPAADNLEDDLPF